MKETIYKLWKGNTLIYIGKTKNFHKRLQQHKHTKCYTFTKATIVNTSKLRKTFGNNVKLMEQHLIEKYKPKFNVNFNPDKKVSDEHKKEVKRRYYQLNKSWLNKRSRK